MTFEERKNELLNQGYGIVKRDFIHDFLNPMEGYREELCETEFGKTIKLIDNTHGDSYCRCDVIYFA